MKGYKFVNKVEGALSALVRVLEGCRVGNPSPINRCLYIVLHLRPPFPRYMETWDVKPKTMGPLHDLPLKGLTLKLVMLMALTQAAWVQALHLLLLRNIIMGENCFTFVMGHSQQCRPKFKVWVIKFNACAPDAWLCVPDFEGIYCKN